MIRVERVVGRSRARTMGRIEFERLRGAHLQVRNLERSMRFYRRVFGWHPVGGTRQELGPSSTLALPDGGRLILHEHGSPAVELLSMADGFGVVVTDLDWARETIWDLGVPVTSDSGEPDHIYRWGNGRSFYVHDPDAHEIELVEVVETTTSNRNRNYIAPKPQARPCWRYFRLP